MRWSDLEFRTIYEYARAIERAATIAAMRRCAEIFDERNCGFGFYEPHEPAEIIRAEIAKLEAEK